MWSFSIQTFATCRSYTRNRTDLGNPKRDIYEFCAYSYPWHQQNEYELCWMGDNRMFITKNHKLMKLGHQYGVTISDKPPGARVYPFINNLPIASYGFNYILRGFGPGEHADYWVGKIEIRSKTQILFNVFGERNYEVPYYVCIH